MDILGMLIVFVAGAAAGFLGGIVGGGGMVSLPVLILLGLPPQVAIATNKIGGFGASVGSMRVYARSKRIDWKLSAILSPIAVLAGLAGAFVLTGIPNAVLRTVIAVVLVLLVRFVLFGRGNGLERKTTSRLKKALGYVSYFLLYIYAGAIGAGTGILILLALSSFFGMTLIGAKAADNLSWILSGIAAIAVYAFYGLIDYSVGLVLLVGMFLGSSTGARLAVLKGNRWVRIILVVATLAAAAKMLFF